MSTQYTETLIIGAGQAGLSTGYHLQRLGRPFLIVDRFDRVGDNWRHQYDSLRLYTPAKYTGLDGLAFPSRDKWSYPTKDEVGDYLEQYAMRWNLPVRTNTAIDRVAARPGGGFAATVGADTIHCDNLVVATGTFGRTPYVPELAADLNPAIRQLHSSEYRNPQQLVPGPVLVVGASHSGTDIAYELAASTDTVLAGRDCGQIPLRWDSRRIRFAFPVLLFVWRHLLTRRTPMGRKAMQHMRFHGGPMLRVQRADLAARGVTRTTQRVTDVRDGYPVLADGTVLEVRNIVWATGFQQRFDWLDVPGIGTDGWPHELRGVADDVPGLFFCGLSFQYAFSSMLLPGVGRDARYLATRIAARASTGTNVVTAA